MRDSINAQGGFIVGRGERNRAQRRLLPELSRFHLISPKAELIVWEFVGGSSHKYPEGVLLVLGVCMCVCVWPGTFPG